MTREKRIKGEIPIFIRDPDLINALKQVANTGYARVPSDLAIRLGKKREIRRLRDPDLDILDIASVKNIGRSIIAIDRRKARMRYRKNHTINSPPFIVELLDIL